MKKLFWELKQYLVQYSPNWNTLCEIEQYILNLEQENKDLKEQLKGTTHCYDEEEHKRLVEENKKIKETLENNTKINLADHKYASEMEGKYLIEHNILIELEKEIKHEYDLINATYKNIHFVKGYLKALDLCLIKLQRLKKDLNKLQELKKESCDKNE